MTDQKISTAIMSARRYYEHLRGARKWPARDDVRIEHLRRACAHAFFLRALRYPPTEADLKFVNAGTALRKVLGVELTGMTCADLRALYESSGMIDHCVDEYVDCVVSGATHHFVSQVTGADGRLIRYDRILFPLGAHDARPDHILGFVDFEAHGQTMPEIEWDEALAPTEA